jgi:plastocyanin
VTTKRVWFAVALGLLAHAISPGAAAPVAKPVTHTVVIDATRFEPEVVTIKAGDTVVWTNNDAFPHTATSTPGGFDSDEIGPGQSWKYTPPTPGEFAYVCTYHRTMKATLRVQ